MGQVQGPALVRRCAGACGLEKVLDEFALIRVAGAPYQRSRECRVCVLRERNRERNRKKGRGKGKGCCFVCAGLPHRVKGAKCRRCGLAYRDG